MDYVTRQFINLTKKFRKELRPFLSKLNNTLDEQTKAIRQNTQAAEHQASPPPEVTVVNNLPESIQIHQNAKDARDEKNYRRATFFVTSLSVAVVVVYAVLVELQYEQMVHATIAAQNAVVEAKNANTLAKNSLESVQRAFVSFQDPQSRRFFKGTLPDVAFWSNQAVIANSGNTPAINLMSNLSIDILPRGQPDGKDFLFLPKQFVPRTIGPKEIQGVGPVDLDESKILGKDYGKGQIVPVIIPPKHVYLYGWVAYYDVFNDTKMHITETCKQLTDVLHSSAVPPQIEFGWSSCSKHNCTDEYCPDYDQLTEMIPKQFLRKSVNTR